MEKHPNNLYSWAFTRYVKHNERFTDHKKLDFKNILEVLDRGKEAMPYDTDKLTVEKNQIWRLKKYLRMVREWDIKFDMTDNQSFLDYDLLPEGHPFKR